MTIKLGPYKSSRLLQYIICSTVLILLLSLPVMGTAEKSHEQKPLKIALFYSNSSSGFWSMVEAFASATAENLNIQLDSYRFGGSPSYLVLVFNKVLNDPATRPDGFLFYNYNHRAELILKEAEKAGVPALMFNAGAGEKDTFGQPRELYRQFIGQITPDDVTAGYELAIELIKQGRELNLYDENNKLQLVAFEGLRASIPAMLRLKGLHKAVSENDDVVLKQQFRTKWERKRAEGAFMVAVKRYPQATLFWAASDSIALGVLDAAKRTVKKAGKHFLTGGIDLLPSTQKLVTEAKLAVSVGAHYSEVVWAVILMNDYLRGCDFAMGESSPVYNSRMMVFRTGDHPVLPGSSREQILEWAKKINFKRWSRCQNDGWDAYSFDPSDLFSER